MRPGPRLFVAAIGAALFLAPAPAAAQEAMQRAPDEIQRSPEHAHRDGAFPRPRRPSRWVSMSTS